MVALKDRQLNTRLQSLSRDQLEEYLALTTRLQELSTSEEGQEKFLKFVKYVWPDFIEGSHHRVYAEKLQAVADGTLKRLIINLPPRHTKSACEFRGSQLPTFKVLAEVKKRNFGAHGRPTQKREATPGG